MDSLQELTMNASVHLAQAFELQRQGKYEQAEDLYKRGLLAQPENDLGWYYRGLCAQAMWRDDLALDYFAKSIELKASAVAWLQLGRSYIRMHQENMALGAFDAGLALKPENSEIHLTRAVTLVTQKKLAEAARALRQAIAHNATCYEAYRHLVKIEKTDKSDPLAKEMRAIIATDDPAVFPLHYALAEIYRGAGDLLNYWKHITRANQLQLAGHPQEMKLILAPFTHMQETFTGERVSTAQRGVGNSAAVRKEPTPIFILGLPRSGTTLIEQILSGHDAIYAGDELSYMRDVVVRRAEDMTGKIFPHGVPDLSPDQKARLADSYLTRMARLAPGSPMVTDKNPENFFLVGLIVTLFPHAIIINVTRNLMDIGLSLYHQSFSYPAAYFNDLSAMAAYMQAYEKLMQHWRMAYPDAILNVCYEDLVARPEETSRMIFERCGLKSKREYLDFYMQDKTVRSLSSLQIRQPIYTESVGRWQAHEPLLRDLKSGLAKKE